jgi:hypothetical protein
LTTNQIGRHRRQPMELIVRPALFDCHVLAFYEPRLVQALAERHHDIRERFSLSIGTATNVRAPATLLEPISKLPTAVDPI